MVGAPRAQPASSSAEMTERQRRPHRSTLELHERDSGAPAWTDICCAICARCCQRRSDRDTQLKRPNSHSRRASKISYTVGMTSSGNTIDAITPPMTARTSS